MENKYGLRLKQLREDKGLTQDQLAKILKTSRSRMAMYEQGKRQPDFEMQETIADYFNVSIDYLFGRDKERYLEALYSSMEKQRLMDSLSKQEQENMEDLFMEILRLNPEGRAHLLDAIKSLLPVLSVRQREEDTTE